MYIFEGISQFIYGIGFGAGVCVFLGRLVLRKHDEQHAEHKKTISELVAEVGRHTAEIAALRSAHDERGALCRTMTKSTNKRSKKPPKYSRR